MTDNQNLTEADLFTTEDRIHHALTVAEFHFKSNPIEDQKLTEADLFTDNYLEAFLDSIQIKDGLFVL